MKCLLKIALLGAVANLLSVGAYPQAQNPAPAAPPAATAPAPQAQTPSAPAAQDQAPKKIVVTTLEVVVPVTVKDKSGNLVADLKRDEFRVFEDGVEQELRRMNSDPVPISMIILIDNDLKAKDMQQVEPSLASIVAGLSNNDEAFVCRFDQFFHEGKGFTKDQDRLITELRRTELASKTSAPPPGDPFGGPTINNAPAPGAPMSTANGSLQAIMAQNTKTIDDAMYASAMLLKDRDSTKRRKVILLISDGRNGEKYNTHKYDVVKEELLRQGITVYAVATGATYFDRKFTRLVSYTKDTGGDIFYGVREDAFSEFYSRISEEARNQYTLIYSPRGDSKVDFHTIEVRVKRQGLTVLARDGYYGGTFASTAPK
jgi:Ca-activated chloride channel homolog